MKNTEDEDAMAFKVFLVGVVIVIISLLSFSFG